MQSPKAHTFTVTDSGEITLIYDDEFADLLNAGAAQITRASYVEPVGQHWQADMSPCGAQAVLGPFVLRSDALAAEVAFLNNYLFTR